MESHPVPQNVTSFEFHLIGDMTIKQFAYLATGLIIAYLAFIFLFPISPVIALPLIGISAGLGVAFAFLPIGDRPLDHWLVAFFKAVYSPTKRFYQLGSKDADPKDPEFQNRLSLYLGERTLPISPASKSSPASTPTLTRLLTSARQNSRPVSVSAAVPQAAPQPAINQNVSVLVAQVIQQNQQLKAQLAQMQHAQPIATATPQPTTTPVAPTVVQAPQHQAPVNYANTQIKIPPLSVAGPNIIAGTIVAPNGAPVDAAIIIITNQNNIPVRAVKTNRTGQFNGATPLPDGEYTLTCEKDGFSCETVKVTLIGELLTPLVINAKEGGVRT